MIQIDSVLIKQAVITNATYKITKGKLYAKNHLTNVGWKYVTNDGVHRTVPDSYFRDAFLPI